MRTTITLFAALFFSIGLAAQNVLIFQPSGGANDSTDEGGIYSGKDTWVNRYSPGDNYGDNEYVLTSPRSNCNTSDYKGYFKFDVSGLPEVVDSVKFGVTHIPHDTYCYSNCIADFYFYYCTSAWNEMTLIQNNLPAENSTPFYGPIPIDFPNDFGTVEYDITSAYNYWKDTNNVNYGFAVYSPTVGCNNASVGFYVRSSDDTIAANRPYLKMFYPSQAGIEEETLTLDVFPNPFGDFISVDLNSADAYFLADITGRRLDVLYSTTTKRIDTTKLPAGLYLLYVTRDGKHAVRKLIKQ